MTRNISLVAQPGSVVSWEDFQSYPDYAIALDGYVSGPPMFNNGGPRANFNHHEVVDRLATRATCAQVLMAIRQGLFSRFRRDGEPTAILYVNDCDEDVCTSVFLLKHPYLAEGTMNPLLNKLVAMEDALDCTAGAYPFPADLPALQELAWIFDPYREFRATGGLERKNAGSYKNIITDVGMRIQKYLIGQGESKNLDKRYKLLPGSTSSYAIVKEVGAHARTGMFSDGIRAYVSVREREDNRFTYTIGRMSPFVFTDTALLAEKLNAVEPDVTSANRWGGGNTIIGSPRMGGSRLSLSEVLSIVDAALSEAP